MDVSRFKGFLEKEAQDGGLVIKKMANNLLDAVLSAEQDEQVSPEGVQAKDTKGVNGEPAKDVADEMIGNTFPDLQQPDPNDSSFGKVASAFISDVAIRSLPKSTQEDINKLIPVNSKDIKVVQYGMVVDELMPKVDPHNFNVAEEHIKAKLKKDGKKKLGDEFQEKNPTKYILLNNDQIIDGHHFLCLAKALGITCSLKVLDLTVIRFQENTKKASLLIDVYRDQYGSNNNCR